MDFMFTELLYDSGPDQCPHTAIHRQPRALVATADVLVGILNPQVQWFVSSHIRRFLLWSINTTSLP